MRFRCWLGSFVLGMLAGWGQTDMPVGLPMVPDAPSGEAAMWRFSESDPGEGWEAPGFRDAAWDTAKGGFGSPEIPGSLPARGWASPGIWMRKAFEAPDFRPDALMLVLHHDDDVAVWLNGTLVHEKSGWATRYSDVYLPVAFTALIKPGRNVLALRCRNNGGPGYIDAGLYLDATLPSKVLVDDALGATASQWSYTTDVPGADWAKPGFDASKWPQGKGGFGSQTWDPVGTFWTTSDIWARTHFRLDAIPPWTQLKTHQEDEIQVYLNGELLKTRNRKSEFPEYAVLEATRKAMRVGTNVLAIHGRRAVTGPRYADAGLIGFYPPLPSRIGPSKGPRAGKVRAPGNPAGYRIDGRNY